MFVCHDVFAVLIIDIDMNVQELCLSGGFFAIRQVEMYRSEQQLDT